MVDDKFSFFAVKTNEREEEDPRREEQWPALLDAFDPATASIDEFKDLLVQAPSGNLEAIRLEGVLIGLQIAQARADANNLTITVGGER